MPRKRRLESDGSSSKRTQKRRRMNDDDDDDNDTKTTLKTLLLARQSLRDTERENLETRVAQLETTIQHGLQTVRRDMIRVHQSRVAEAIQGILRERISFPIDYNVSMNFIESYTGVKKRGAPEVVWNDKVSRSWLNRQRAKVYGPTLFKEFLDFVVTIAQQIAQSDSPNAEWLRRAVKRKLVTEILSATFKPLSKQSSAKKLICANAAKESQFTDHLCSALDWQPLPKETTLQQMSYRAQSEYDGMIAAGYGVWNEKDTKRRVESDEDSELDVESPRPSSMSVPMIPPDCEILKLCRPPNFSATMNDMPSPVPRIPVGSFGCVSVDDGIAGLNLGDELEMLNNEELVRRCRDLEANNYCLRDQLKMYQERLSELYKDSRERQRIPFGGGNRVGCFSLPGLPLNLNFAQQAAVIPYMQQSTNPSAQAFFGHMAV